MSENKSRSECQFIMKQLIDKCVDDIMFQTPGVYNNNIVIKLDEIINSIYDEDLDFKSLCSTEPVQHECNCGNNNCICNAKCNSNGNNNRGG